MNKRAFNLAEVLLVLVLIGTISVLSTQVVIRTNNNYRSMYYTAYNALLQAAGNSALEWNPTCQCPDYEAIGFNVSTEKCWSKSCWEEYEYKKGAIGNSIDIGVKREYPGYLLGTETIGDFNGYATDKYFCKQLTSKLNTINETIECQYFINAYAENKSLNYAKGIDFKTAFCNKHILTPDEYNNNTEATCKHEILPSFVTANGQRFYISKLLSTNANSSEFLNKKDREFFRLVAVDLNGSSGPNTQLKKASGRLPDIVLFALRSDGSVVPLGLPEFNQNYANAVVQYPKYLHNYDESGKIKENKVKTSNAMALYDAKAQAWGIKSKAGIDINSGLAYGQVFSDHEPLSYTPLLHKMSIICRSTSVGGETPKDATCPSNRYTDELLARIITQFTFDQKGRTERITKDPQSPDADVAHGCDYRYSPCGVQLIEAK